jgi:hypothetical protein
VTVAGRSLRRAAARLGLLVAACGTPALAAGADEPAESRWVERATLADGRTVVVSEGDFEPRGSGSYTVHLYADGGPEAAGRFVVAISRPRDGRIARLLWHDFDRDGRAELVVVLLGDGASGPLSADAYSFGRSRIARRASVAGLAPDADPIGALAPRVRRATAP